MKTILFVCVFLFACGEVKIIGSDGGSGGQVDASLLDANMVGPCSGPEIALEDLEACYIKANCQRLVTCTSGFPSQAFCEENMYTAKILGAIDGLSANQFEEFREKGESTVIDYHSDQAFLCLQNYIKMPCSTDPQASLACQKVLQGKAADGEACIDDDHCGYDVECEKLTTGRECARNGICTVKSYLALEANCSPEKNINCRPEHACVGDSSTRLVCQDKQAGAQCNSEEDCDLGLYCSMGALSVCKNKKMPNEACLLSKECPGNQLCIERLCSDVNTAGKPCKDRCLGNLYCSLDGFCTERPGEGENCAEIESSAGNAQRSQCNSIELECGVERLCKALKKKDESCNTVELCGLGLLCDKVSGGQFRCKELVANGEMCEVDQDCLGFYCDKSQVPSLCGTPATCYDNI